MNKTDADELVALCHEISHVLDASTPLGRFQTEASWSETHALVRMCLDGLAIPTAKARRNLDGFLATARENQEMPDPPSWEEIGRAAREAREERERLLGKPLIEILE